MVGDTSRLAEERQLWFGSFGLALFDLIIGLNSGYHAITAVG